MKIGGMTCQHCEVAVERALRGAGANPIWVDFHRGEGLIDSPAGVDDAALKEAIREAGYQPGPIETEQPKVEAQAARSGGSSEGYDLAIVGSGSAAFAAAIRATELGARAVMVERGTLGGTCVNVGCVPSKTLLRAGDLYYQAGHHPFHDIETHQSGVNLAPLVDQKDELVRTLRREKYEDLIREYGWDLIRGEAAFSKDGSLAVNGDRLDARYVVLATGSSPAVPPIPGLAGTGYLTSTTAMELRKLPQSLVVIGSGYVALELGQFFRHLGSNVTLMQRGPRILKEYDPEISEAAYQAMSAEGMNFVTGAKFKGVERIGGGYRVIVEVGDEARMVEAEQLLVATGRQPNTSALRLERAGVAVGNRGQVEVDDYLRTSNPRVFAAGDVTLDPQFVYVAAYEGALAADNALTGAPRQADLRAVPAVIFTTPSVAAVGMTEQQARAAGHDVKVSVLPAKAVPRALVNRELHGVFKVVADAGSDRVLGVQVVAENAGEVIYAATLAVKFGLTVQDLVETFAPYLTMAEGLKLAARTFSKDVAKLSCCA